MKFSMSTLTRQASWLYGTGIILLFEVLVLTVYLSACSCSLNPDQDKYDQFVKKYFSGEHRLHKLSSSSGYSQSGNGFFILGIGGYSSSGEVHTVVRFAWEYKKDQYMLTTVPIDYVQVKLVESQAAPTITFHTRSWGRSPIMGPFNYTDLTSRLVDGSIDGVTVICRPDQWPLDLSGLKKLE